MAMKKCSSHPDVLYVQSEEWSKDKCGPGWRWISSDAEYRKYVKYTTYDKYDECEEYA
jgi:hypothetical protein